MNEEKKLSVSVDKDKCTGCTLCNSIAPEVFVMNDELKAEVLDGVNLVEHEDDIKEAADSCYAEAIYVN